LNAAAALVAAGIGEGDLVKRIAAGLELATRSVDSGAAADVLDRWIAASS
jgi:anthranilate phosphoribosyltransferase